jgi:peptide deformylase
MALRKIREIGDPILNKTCKEVKEITDRTKDLIDDMFETMYEAQGVGLAAPQVGILKRIVVIDCGDDPLLLINPEVLETSGERTGRLSFRTGQGRYCDKTELCKGKSL